MQKRDLRFEVSPREFAYAAIIEYSTQLFTEDKVCYSVTRGNGRILNILLAPVWLIIVYIFFYQIRSDRIIAVYITCLIGKFRGHLCSEPFVANSSIDFSSRSIDSRSCLQNSKIPLAIALKSGANEEIVESSFNGKCFSQSKNGPDSCLLLFATTTEKGSF